MLIVLNVILLLFKNIDGNEEFQLNKEDKPLELQVHNCAGTYYITINFNGLFEIKTERINLELPFSLFSANILPLESKNIKYLGKEFVLFKEKIPLDHCQDHIRFQEWKDNQTIPLDFYFYESNFPFHYKDQGFGFAFKMKNSNFDIIKQLKKHNFIQKEVFSVQTLTPTMSRLLFSLLPQKDILLYTYKGICNVDTKYDTWGCRMKKVVIDSNITYENDEYAYFQYSEREIYAPNDFIETIRTTFLKDLLELGICLYHDLSENNGSSYFECDCYNIPDIKIWFYLGNYRYSFNLKDLFEKKYRESCFMLIQKNINNKYTWILGSSFLVNYATEFDYENKKVTLYGNNIIEQVYFEVNQDMINNIIRGIIYFSVFCCSIGIILFCFQNYLLQKSDSYSEKE